MDFSRVLFLEAEKGIAMNANEDVQSYAAFAGTKVIAEGDLKTMLTGTKAHIDRRGADGVLIFVDQTGEQVDFDFRGSVEDVLRRAEPRATKTGPGRPKLGVVSREVTLMPRHWEWLEQQPNGISAALRRLVDNARKQAPNKADARRVIDAAGRFMWAMAGNFPSFEEASRALFAKDGKRFASLIRRWPKDVRQHLLKLVKEALPESAEAA